MTHPAPPAELDTVGRKGWERLFAAPLAHRGLWSPDGAPENSLAAFEAAAEAGYGMELDVQLSADGEAVVFHDDRLDSRMTAGSGRIAERTAAELANVRLGASDETIPTLAQVLDRVGGRGLIAIELKVLGGDEGPLERRVAEVIANYGGPFAIIGFNPKTIGWFAEHKPGMLRGLNSTAYHDAANWMLDPAMREGLANLEHVAIARPHFLSLGLDMLPSARADAMRAEGLPVVAWTVRSRAQWDRIADHCDNPIFEGLAALIQPHVRTHRRISEIGREAWEACTGAANYRHNPFVSYDFLDALEESGCVAPRAGWAPQHLSVEDADGQVTGVMPLYLKSHSQGEYVFDHAWANAYERAGGRYYPKLQCASPFSPVTGPRLITREGPERAAAEETLIAGALTLCDRLGASSLHVTFPLEDEWRRLGEAGLLLRQDKQYHWENRGYATFDDFLASLSSGRRKTIRRERRDAQAGLEIEAITGADLTEAHWDAFFEFYMDTGGRKWGRPYLNRRFFSLLSERMADRILLLMARRGNRWIAGALNLMGDDCLYGRNWGCVEDVPFLHFELCYYQAIEQAIIRGLARVEAGAQGDHKIARGYLPSFVYSAHWIADAALREPVARYLEEERAEVAHEMDYLAEHYSPFRQPD